MNTRTRLGVLFAAALGIILAVGIGAYISEQALLDANRWVTHTHLVHERLERVLSLHAAAENGERGFLLTGESRYLEQYNSARARVSSDLASLHELVRDNPVQVRTLETVGALSDAKFDEMQETLAVRRAEGLDAALRPVETDRGRQLTEDLQETVARMQARERDLLAARERAARASAHRTSVTLVLWLPASLLLLTLFAMPVLGRVRFGDPLLLPAAEQRSWPAIGFRYGVAVVVVAAAFLLRWGLVRLVGPLPIFITFYPAVLVAAVVAGGGPGIVASVLAALLTDYFLVEPTGSFDALRPNDLLALCIFTGSGLFVSLLAERLRRARWAEAVAEEKELLSVTLTSIGDGVIVTDTRGCVTLLNGEAERLTGWSSAEAVGRPLPEVFRIVNEHTRQPVDNPADKVLRMGTLVGLANHTLLIARDGRETAIDDSGAPVRTPDGTVRGVVLVFRDFSEQKAAERALRQSEALFRAVIETSPSPIFLKDIEGRIVLANKAIAVKMGKLVDEVLGKTDLEIYGDHDAGRRVMDDDRRVLESGCTQTFEEIVPGPDGPRTFISTKSPHRDPEGRIIGTVGVALDITNRKRMEQELEAAKVSAERAKAIAEEATRAKDHFLAVLSHELRTPLTPVVTALSMLRGRHDLDAATRDSVEMIRRNVDLETRLIDDLLDLTRVARGKIELDRRPTDLRTVIEGAVEVCKPDIEARGLDVAMDVEDGPLVVDADPTRLQQVFWNLLRNAIKFTPRGGRVGISCRCRDGVVVVDVRDSGQGIEPEALGAIFDAFVQAERSIARQFGGLGLGLTISKALVELHGGRIEADSDGVGRGATFRVRLPVLAALAPAAAEPSPSLPAVKGLRILLVEDHGDTAMMMQQLLTLEGHEVEHAGDVATALGLARRGGFDLLISDLGLPDASGLDLMRTLRAGGAAIPAIALSGYGQEADIRLSAEAGFVAHLTKPADPAQLTETIAGIFSRR